MLRTRLILYLSIALVATSAARAAEPAIIDADDTGLLSAVESLVSDIRPSKDVIRPPFDLGRFIKHIKHKEYVVRYDIDHEFFRTIAVNRQDRLLSLWRSLDMGRLLQLSQQNPALKADAAFIRYAFGEGSLESAVAAARQAGPHQQLRLADLLLAECRFNPALEELFLLADGLFEKTGDANVDAGISDSALFRLTQIKAGVDYLATLDNKMFFDFDYDLDSYLDRHGAVVQTFIERHERVFDRTLNTHYYCGNEPENDGIPDGVLWPIESLKRWQMQVNCGEIALRRHPSEGDDKTVHYRDRFNLKLDSMYNGTIEFSVYHFDYVNYEIYDLAVIEPASRLSKEFLPLDANNRQTLTNQTVEVETPAEGFYIVTADARYCPVKASYFFPVSRTALYARTYDNALVIQSLSRTDASAAPNIPFPVNVTKRMTFMDAILKYCEKDPELLKRVQERRTALKLPNDIFEKEKPTEKEVAQLNRFVMAVEDWIDLDDIPEYEPIIEEETVTDGKGLTVIPLSLSRTEVYDIEAYKTTPGAAGIEIEYKRKTVEPFAIITFFSDRPCVSSGETARFKGYVRMCDGYDLHHPSEYDIEEIEIKINREKGQKDERLSFPVDDYGSFAFEIENLQPDETDKIGLFFGVQGKGMSNRLSLAIAVFVSDMTDHHEYNANSQYGAMPERITSISHAKTYSQRSRVNLNWETQYKYSLPGAAVEICATNKQRLSSASVFVDHNQLIAHYTLSETTVENRITLHPQADWWPGVRLNAITFDNNKTLTEASSRYELFVPPLHRALRIEIETTSLEQSIRRLDFSVFDADGNRCPEISLTVSAYSAENYDTVMRHVVDLLPSMYRFTPETHFIAELNNVDLSGEPLKYIKGPKYGYGNMQCDDDSGVFIDTIFYPFGVTGKMNPHRWGGRIGGRTNYKRSHDPEPSISALWSPNLINGADGKASIELSLPQGPRAWRVVVYAASKSVHFGHAQTIIYTTNE